MRTFRILLTATSLGMACGAAHAEPVDTGSDGRKAKANATVSYFDDQADQIELLKQEKEIETLKNQIAQERKSRMELELGGRPDPDAHLASATPAPPPEPPPLPRVEQIIGDGRRMTAEIILPDGAEMTVQHGTKLRGGLTVDAISNEGVSVMTPNGPELLPFDIGRQPTLTSAADPVSGQSGASPQRFIPNLSALGPPVTPDRMLRFPPLPPMLGRK
jgi:type IV pilus biogenesis protein PilP